MADTEDMWDPVELRQQIGRALESKAKSIVGESIAVSPFTSLQALDPDYCARICARPSRRCSVRSRWGATGWRKSTSAHHRSRSRARPGLLGLTQDEVLELVDRGQLTASEQARTLRFDRNGRAFSILDS
jgi:hypothetical protein